MAFQPGKSGNPKGRPKVPGEVKSAKRLTTALFYDILHKLMAMKPKELQVYAFGDQKAGIPGKADSLEAMVAAQMIAAMKGKTTPIAFLFDRSLGPIKQQFAVSIETDVGRELANMTEEQKRARLELIRARDKA